MTFWFRKKEKHISLEQRVYGLLTGQGPLDVTQICVEFSVNEAEVKRVLEHLVERELVEPRFDSGKTEVTQFSSSVWGASTGFRKKVREQRRLVACWRTPPPLNPPPPSTAQRPAGAHPAGPQPGRREWNQITLPRHVRTSNC